MNKHFSLLVIFCLALTLASGTLAATKKVKKTKPAKVTFIVDQKLVGFWGVDAKSTFEFRPNGLLAMKGKLYKYSAAKGSWSYWLPAKPFNKARGEYKLSPDGKSLRLNLSKGTPLTTYKKIK